MAAKKRSKRARSRNKQEETPGSDLAVDRDEPSTDLANIKPRHELFCKYYVMYHNASQAARLAGYTAKNSGHQGYDLIHNPVIQKRIQQLEEATAAYLETEWQKRLIPAVIARQENFAVADIRDFMDPDTGEITLQSIQRAPAQLKAKSITVRSESRDLPDGGHAESTSISIQLPDQERANSKLAKWTGLEKPDQVNIGNIVVLLGDYESKF